MHCFRLPEKNYIPDDKDAQNITPDNGGVIPCGLNRPVNLGEKPLSASPGSGNNDAIDSNCGGGNSCFLGAIKKSLSSFFS